MVSQKNKLSECWKEVELGEVAEFINGRTFKPSEWEEEGKIIIRIQDLTGNIENPHFTKQPFDDKYLVRKGDLLISWSATLDAFIWNKEDGWLNQHIFKVVEKKEIINRKYLFYLIKTKINEMKINTHGSTMKHITKGNFNSIKFILPPLQVQNQIVSILEKAEELKQKREDAYKLAKKYLQSVFSDIFGDKDKFEEKKIGDIAECLDGDWILSENMSNDGEIGIVQLKHLGEGHFLYKCFNFITNETCNKLGCTVLETGDLLVSRMAEPICRSCILPNLKFKVITAVDVAIIRPNNKIVDKNFLNFMFNSHIVKEQAAQYASGTTRLRISRKNLERIKIPLPPLPIQQKFASIVEHVEKIKEKQQKSKEEIDNLFNSLMQKAFNGELVR